MNFIIVNDIRQPMDEKSMGSNPAGPSRWTHHATIKRGFKEYIIFRHNPTGKIYLEEVETHRATLILKLIEDEQEWQDLHQFAKSAGLLAVIGTETKTSNGQI